MFYNYVAEAQSIVLLPFIT